MEEHSKKKAHQISLKAFLHTFLRAGKNNQRYCFILGSGASREAGIHTGVQMAEIWARELKEKYEENELKELMRELGIESIEPNSKNYFGIYELLYYDNYQEGYAFFEKELEKGGRRRGKKCGSVEEAFKGDGASSGAVCLGERT